MDFLVKQPLRSQMLNGTGLGVIAERHRALGRFSPVQFPPSWQRVCASHDFGRGDDKVGNPHRAQLSQFELFELIILLDLEQQLSIEQFEATASQSTVPSPLLLLVFPICDILKCPCFIRLKVSLVSSVSLHNVVIISGPRDPEQGSGGHAPLQDGPAGGTNKETTTKAKKPKTNTRKQPKTNKHTNKETTRTTSTQTPNIKRQT